MSDLMELAVDRFVEAVGPKLLAFFKANWQCGSPDKLLTANQAAEQLGISETKMRHLVTIGAVTRAPGMDVVRIRQSALDAYGKPERKGKP